MNHWASEPHVLSWSTAQRSPTVLPPQMSFGSDSSPWYPPVSLPTLNYSEEKLDQIKIHDFWQARLAPFPGYSSRPGLFPVKKYQPVPIDSSQLAIQLPKLQLLPPRSMFTSTMSPTGPTIEPSTELNAEKNNVRSLSFSGPSILSSRESQIFQFDKYVSLIAYMPLVLIDTLGRRLYTPISQRHPKTTS